MRSRLWLAALTIALAGCGGGSGSGGGGTGSPADQGVEHTVTIGNFVTRVSGTTQQPISVASASASITGIAGGTVSSLVLSNPSPTPANSAQILGSTKLTFSRNGQIYTMSPFGGGTTQLTTLAISRLVSRPVWSPDGTKILFAGRDYSSGYNQLYLMNANGTGVARLSNGTADDFMPSWTPAGNKIAFTRLEPSTGLNQIYVMSAAGTGVTRVTDDTTNDSDPSWSPGGDKIAYVHPLGGYTQIFVINADGSGSHAVLPSYSTQNSYGPAWSPDGSKIVFEQAISGGRALVITRPDGQDSQLLTDGTSIDVDAAWSPDSTRIAFARYNSGLGKNQIWVMHEDGTSPVLVDDGAANDQFPSWSPYIKARRLVGAGSLTATAAGFLAGQQGSITNSLVLFNATTPDSAFINVPTVVTPGQPQLAFTVSADKLTSLTFTNNFEPATTVLSSTNTATGAVVTFDANLGTVAAVLPFTSNKAALLSGQSVEERRGDELVLRRAFTGVWNGKGMNVAPEGAREVHVSAKTGRMISFR